MFIDCAIDMNLNWGVAFREEILYVAINVHTNTKYYILSKEIIMQTSK